MESDIMLHETEKKVKEKVTITLKPHLIKEVDRWSKKEKIGSRSAAIERLIEQWIAAGMKSRLDAETEAYYLSLSENEKKEDKEWVSFSSNQALHQFQK
jgi:metal-responsive CopG/Arc/MetJ family transcriptional regulator